MNNKQLFILKVAKNYLAILFISSIFYFFTKHNLVFNFTAKKFVNDFSRHNLSITQEIAEERSVVFQNIIQNKNKHFRHLIIGSSRVMQFGEMTGFKNALNLGVSGANLNDIEFLYNTARNYNITYDTIIFDFNPWLAAKDSDGRYKQFDFNYQLKKAVLDILKFNYNYEDLINFFGLINNYKLSYKIASDSEISNHSHFIKLKDGSIQQKNLSQRERNNQIKIFVQELYQMGNFYQIDTFLFDRTVALYNSASVFGKCLVTLTPFHHDVFISKGTDKRVLNITFIEQKLLNSKKNFNICGSFDPRNIQVAESDFLDGFHLREFSICKIFKNKLYTK